MIIEHLFLHTKVDVYIFDNLYATESKMNVVIKNNLENLVLNITS